MLINYDLKAIFFHSVKCGGNFCKFLLHQYGFMDTCRDIHENYIDFVDNELYIKDIKDKHTIRKMGKYRYYYSHQDCNKEYMDNYFKFTFVRNPYSKIVSAYMYLTRRLNSDNNTIRGLEENPEYFADFATFVKNYKSVNNISFFHAFIPQYEHIVDFSMNPVFQYIGKQENLNNELINIFSLLGIKEFKYIEQFMKVTKHNESEYEKSISEYFDEQTFNFVNDFFKKDFEAFGYKRYDTFEEFKENYEKDIEKIESPIEILKKSIDQFKHSYSCYSFVLPVKKSHVPDYFIKMPSKIPRKNDDFHHPQLIPRILIQTYKNNYLHPQVYKNAMKNLEKNPTYDYYFINDEDGEKIIKEHFDERTLIAFKKLKMGAAKGDFIRLIALYIYGGVYLDLDSSINICLDAFIPPNNEHLFFYEANKCQITNWCMMITPNHIITKKLIDEMVNRIIDMKEINILLVTGPYLFTDVIYNHFSGLNIFNSYEELNNEIFLEFILKNNKPPILFETYFLCEKLKIFSFVFYGYHKNMLYYNEKEYDIIDDFNIYTHEKKNTNIETLSNIQNLSNHIQYIYLIFVRDNNRKDIINKYSKIAGILLEKIINQSNYKLNDLKTMKNELDFFYKKYCEKTELNNTLLDILIDSKWQNIKQSALLTVKSCENCAHNCYNDTCYMSHRYFCQKPVENAIVISV